ncbi:MBL fold metallo-hydrolase [Parvularcula oceani]|uniref:MBL fold metallo-hydrolase n=1 Tax=Parvularcula oceani TaxID=1247963 RepID=UPI0004E0DC61|nr:MBL fold metallo-hydrolase [Parvularcula oceani]
MILEKIKSDGLAHLSYFLGSGSEAAVIDPRRDIEAYLDLARRNGMRIVHIFETHRNEDLVSGAPALASVTGAKIWHGPNPAEPIVYADTARQGDGFAVGDARIEVLETPGHTDDSLSYALHDSSYDDGAVGVFTGDALFVGDVGRTDFYPDRKREVAGLLFDSLRKILSLGDQAILYPAHGAGSVCGSGMADREFSTLGHERANNPRLRIEDREAFIDAKVAEHHYQPPYFRLMEQLNAEGGGRSPRDLLPPPVGPEALYDLGGAQLVDVRGVADFAGAHVPGAYCIPSDMIAAFAGWFLDADRDIVLVARDADQAAGSTRTLARIGYDRVVGYHAGIVPVATKDRAFASVPLVDTQAVNERVDQRADRWTLLDVRSVDEFEAGHVEGAQHAYVGELPSAAESLAKNAPVTVMCGSGARASIAASILLQTGWTDVDVYLGSMKAWKAGGYRTIEGR